ncbi:GNAT family N-acetyltransferase [Sporosarcina thermotolerans]|uniref:GNAT family N-acetyltransferase n=1 Tax=Sporosarcina thermotolerans TaxID=633404 RepID=A0AAW9ABS6_9BACL|nr:GNAT family N-acetyltransferase [Sporosarcina thermotolerans]MDW0118642.1 GNAT family N-acetyltransferase [Sporosarcina thermotolerans]WHT49566.1 GNAT family N-acetyltransferase [Sporosarcina thermotolerans]
MWDSNLFTIDCGEIILREFTSDDVDHIFEITSQPEVYEFLPDWRSTKEQRLNWLTNYEIPANKEFLAAVPMIGNQNYLKLGIILKETGEFIGFCTTGIKEELSEPNREIAYAISKQYRNRGYTTTAVKGLVNFLFQYTDVDRLNTVVLPRNGSSNKVSQKCGFRLNGETEIEGQIHFHYTLTKEEWKRINSF